MICRKETVRTFNYNCLKNGFLFLLALFMVSCGENGVPWGNKGVIEDLTPQGAPNVSFDHCTPSNAIVDSVVFGMHIHGEHQTSLPTLNAIDDIQLKWVLNGFHWPTVEGQRDVYRIAENYDQFFLEMAQRNVNVLMSVGNYWPTWLEDTEQLKVEAYELTRLLVKRYRPGGDFAQEYGLGNYGVRYWELINEPNYPCCGWGSHGAEQPVNSALYAELMSEMHRAIRAEAPDVFIVFGGLSSTDRFQDPMEFLDNIYSYGGKDAFDIFAYHPYDEAENLSQTIASIRSKMSAYGDAEKPIWITEIGDPDLVDGPNGEPSQVRLFDMVASQFYDVEALFWLGINDFDGQNETWGILENNQQPRQPIYGRVKTFLDTIQ